MTNGRVPRIRFASVSIFVNDAPTCCADKNRIFGEIFEALER